MAIAQICSYKSDSEQRSRSMSIIGVADESPVAPTTWSGSSAHFFSALADRGLLAATISADPPQSIKRLLQARTFSPNYECWRFKYHLDPALFAARTRAARRRIHIHGRADRTILQIGAICDLTDVGMPVVSYHDGNLARRLDSPFPVPRISRQRIRRALEVESYFYERVEVIFTMSQWLADSFEHDFRVPRRKLCPIYAGINMPDVHAPAARHSGSKNILFVGKEFDRKGGAVLLKAFSRVRRVIRDATLTIVGPTLPTLGPGIICRGFVSKTAPGGLSLIRQLYADAAIFVLPTLYEPFGISYVEAMAHSVPCIGTRICAVPEIIDCGRTGLLVSPHDDTALASAMINLLSDQDKAASFGEAGFEKYRQTFTWTKVAERVRERLARSEI